MLRIDPTTGRIVATVQNLGAGLQWLFGGGGLVWAPSATSLVAVDPSSNKVAQTFSGAFSLNGVDVDGRIWIGNHRDKLLEVDASTGKTIRTIASGGPGEALGEDCLNEVAYGAGAVWWAVNDTGTVERVDPGSGNETAKIAGFSKGYVTTAGSDIWVNSNDGMLRRIDPASNTVADSVTLHGPAADNCAGPTAVDGSTMWIVADGNYAAVYRFDLGSRKPTGFFDPGDTYIQTLAVTNHSVWIDHYDSGLIGRYDLPTP